MINGLYRADKSVESSIHNKNNSPNYSVWLCVSMFDYVHAIL